MSILDKDRTGIEAESTIDLLAEQPLAASVAAIEAVGDDCEEMDHDWPEIIPLPDGLAGPCHRCGTPPNPIFWKDRWGVLRCAACDPCPAEVVFGRLLVMQVGRPPDAAPHYWLVERNDLPNPWRGPSAEERAP